MNIEGEFKASSEIFARFGGPPVQCPKSGTDKEKLLFLLEEHRKRLKEGSVQMLQKVGIENPSRTAAVMAEATMLELTQIKRLTELLQQAK
ncbi:MAG: hypothetical protein MUF81_10890 [Verrucomicrobia bacterium]|nr:hypothetical protein [Verrucomicrobiota bacterium]